ncbi:MAG: flagellar hook-length control protein FliK [Ruminiclostridium sp.]|nr:flagellar hook-length control protein FliK [Ruminiclostridium sp.]
MLTKAVSMDMKVGTANRGGQRGDADNGFSDVLGSVRKDGGGQEPGRRGGEAVGRRSSNAAGRPGGEVTGTRETGRKFTFTEKAGGRPAGSISDDMRGQPGMSGSPAGGAEQFDAAAADELLTKAAELVTQTVRETGEKPDRTEAAEMLSEALKTLKSGDEEARVPEDALIDAVIQVLAAVSDSAAEGAAAAGTVTDDMRISDIADLPVDEAAAAVGEAASEIADGTEAAVTGEEAPETEPEHTAGETFAKAVQTLTDEPADGGEIFRQTAEQSFEDDGLKAFVGESVQKLADGKLSVEAAAVDFETAAAAESEEAPDLSEMTVTETVKLLADLIEEVKDELGITEISARHVYGGNETAATMAEGSHAELSNRMFRTDRTGELDHILNGTRADLVAGDGKKPETETETYDAVHMAAELVGSRTETDIPVENEPMFPEAAEVRPPEVQTAEQILDRISTMQDDHTEFTMVLNPESLGRITVKIAAAGERISVEITADDPRTGAMLAARNEGLQNMLRDSGVQLEKCQIVSEHEDTQFNEQSYDGSSKNPYGRQDGENKKPDDDDGENFYDLLQSI